MSQALLKSIAGLSAEKRAALVDLLKPEPEPIAIIGMACRFPGGVNSPDQFWEFLASGSDGIVEVPANRWDVDAFYDPDPDAKSKAYTRYGGYLPDVGLFDSDFFGISPREAMRMDPQQRLLLEVTWAALENAGQAAEQLAGSATGVFVGIIDDWYTKRQMMVEPGCIDDPYFLLGNSSSSAAGRLSYVFNFQGPSIALDTACSSSLVALHLGCQSLRNNECRQALVGGVNVVTLPETVIALCKMRMLAADGRCKTFDGRADGFGLSEGCGMVVLKRLADALADGDNVLAVIRGSAVNEDGRSNGLTAPNGLAQQTVIRKALANARIPSRLISYVEAHGSGTALGDPIEVESVQAVLNQERPAENPLLIGAVKSNIGHLTAAAGVASLIKTVLSLQHRMIPPHLHLQEPNPNIAWDERIQIATELTPWTPVEGRYLAGISSFGWAGTNAHVIVERPEPEHEARPSRPQQLLLLSAKSEAVLNKTTQNLARHLEKHGHEDLADVAYTLQTGRNAFDYRRMVVCGNRSEAAVALETGDPRRVLSNKLTETQRPVTFMFPGLGDQYVSAGAQLYREERVFRQHVDHCCELLQPQLGLDLRQLLYPEGAESVTKENTGTPDLRQLVGQPSKDNDESRLNQTFLAQPLTFIIEYALAQLWISWGIRPQAMIGYSLGEYVAACLAGVFSLRDGLNLVTRRARMIDSLPDGAMLAVTLPQEKVTPLLNGEVSLSAVNGPMMCVVAGRPDAIAELEPRFDAEGIAYRRLQVSHAFHSHMMEPVQASLIELMQTVTLSPPQIPFVSDVSGTWITEDQATDPAYWATHLRLPVHFASGLQTLWQKPDNILLEVGIGQMLGSLALQHPARAQAADPVVLSSLPAADDQQSDVAYVLRTLGQLWLAGAAIDWSGFYAHEQRRRRPLPTYPFSGEWYWTNYPDSSQPTPARLPAATQRQPEPKKEKLDDWFYVPTWRRTPPLRRNVEQPQSWLFFVDDCGLGMSLVEHLRECGQTVTIVQRGDSFRRVDDDAYTINPRARNDYTQLLKHMFLVNKPPDQIVHMWSVTVEKDAPVSEQSIEEAQESGFYSLLFLAQALGRQQTNRPAHLSIISSNMQDVLGGDGTSPEKATVLGPCRVIPKEYEEITCCSIDVVWPPPQLETLVEQLLAELLSNSTDMIVAYRGRARWVQSLHPTRLDRREENPEQLRHGGVYLITGGFGGLGFALAEQLARLVKAKLVMLGRTALPPRETWSSILADDSTSEQVQRRIRQVQTLESIGAEVLPAGVDVADRAQMKGVIDEVHERFGNIDGVFHAAGVPAEGVIQFKDPEAVQQVFRPKLQGTLALTSILEEAPDFIVLYSSINSLVGALGEVDYAAANAFLDAFAHYYRFQQSIPTVSINWGLWQWDAWQSSLLASMPEIYEQVAQMRRQYGITFDEGAEALWRILSTPLSQVAVLPLDLDTTIAQWHSLTSPDFLETIRTAQNNRTVYARPELRNPYVAPHDETQKRIAEIWAEALAIEKVGIHDHFLELGGNSLLGILIISRLEKEFDVDLSAAILYEGPTVSQLSNIIQPNSENGSSLARDQERGKRRLQRRRKRRKRRQGG